MPVSSSLDPIAVDEYFECPALDRYDQELADLKIKFMMWREWSPHEHGKKKELREQYDMFIKMGFSKHDLIVVYFSDKSKQVQPCPP